MSNNNRTKFVTGPVAIKYSHIVEPDTAFNKSEYKVTVVATDELLDGVRPRWPEVDFEPKALGIRPIGAERERVHSLPRDARAGPRLSRNVQTLQ